MRRRLFLKKSFGSLLLVSEWQVSALASTMSGVAPKRSLQRIAFGSCAQQADPQPIWSAMLEAKPDLFVFIGDNIYADTEDMNEMAGKYELLAAKPEFRKFRQSVPVIATWDDHDFGINDGGAEYPKKEESKRLMLDFFGEPAHSKRRARPGVYTSYIFGPADRKVQIVLLDLRWFRSPLVYDKKIEGYVPNPDPEATMLGEKQWSWLETELRKPAHVRIIASSTQFSSPDHPWEKWSNFPYEKGRMLGLIDRLDVRNAVFISGDMHYGELSAERTPGGIELLDLTSSGMNLFEPGAQFPNKNRIEVYDKSANFGFIEIDWRDQPVTLALQVRDDRGRAVIEKKVRFALA